MRSRERHWRTASPKTRAPTWRPPSAPWRHCSNGRGPRPCGACRSDGRRSAPNRISGHRRGTMGATLSWPDILLRLAGAFIAGLLIGLDRGEHAHPVGLRTTILITVAAAVAMVQA